MACASVLWSHNKQNMVLKYLAAPIEKVEAGYQFLPMVTLKNILHSSHEERQVPVALLYRCVSLLISGIALRVYSFDDVEYSTLKTKLQKLNEEFMSEGEDKSWFGTITKILKLLELYTQRSEYFVSSTISEARYTIKVMVEALARSEKVESQLDQLDEIEKALQRANNEEAFLHIRKRIERYLHQKEERQSGELLSVGKIEDIANDSPTGLRGRDFSIALVSNILKEQRTCYGVGIRLDCFPVIQSRYGKDAAFDFLNAVAHYLVQALGDTDTLFHWENHCLFLLLDRNIPQDSVAYEVQRLSRLKHEVRIEVNGRPVIFAVPVSTEFMLVDSPMGLKLMVEKLNQFARS